MMNLVNSVMKPFQDEMKYRSFWADGCLYRINGVTRQPMYILCVK
jgi:hypothetical protein